ncbi:MAG: TIM barrel protein [Sphaerochaetaceae bacterium]|nr:TIM barrel protein [Sphaerochaetaceae bacterium]
MKSQLPALRPYRLCAVITAFFPQSYRDLSVLLDGFRVCRDLGFDAVEFFYEGDYRSEIDQELKILGLESIFAPSLYAKMHALQLAALDVAERKQAVKTMCGYLDMGMRYGAKQAMLVSGTEGDASDIPAALSRLQESIGEICTHAYRKNAEFFITMETFNNTGEPYYLLGPTGRSVDFAESVRLEHKNFGLTIDLSHLTQLKEPQAKAIESARSVCNHIHIANCVVSKGNHPLFGDKHPPLDYPEGDVDTDTILMFVKQFLKDSAYHPTTVSTIGLEVIARAPATFQETAASTKAYFDRLIKRFEGGVL